jgi:hypothetical protein
VAEQIEESKEGTKRCQTEVNEDDTKEREERDFDIGVVCS